MAPVTDMAASAARLRPVDAACDGDLWAIARVAWATWPDAYRGILPALAVEEHLRAAYTPAALRSRVALDGGLFLLAEAETALGQQPVGYCQAGLRVASPRDADLWAIYVHPQWQGRGIGRQLTEAAHAFAAGCRLHVALAADNLAAAAFYSALGFAPEGAGYMASIQGAPVAMRSMVRDPQTT